MHEARFYMNELNRKIDHEPEGSIGVLYLILFLLYFLPMKLTLIGKGLL